MMIEIKKNNEGLNWKEKKFYKWKKSEIKKIKRMRNEIER